jgi:hypothetical protein
MNRRRRRRHQRCVRLEEHTMTTPDYLAQYGITMQQAHDFVFANLDAPDRILSVALQYGVTTTMLGDIAGGYSATDVRAFFSAHGLDASPLDGGVVVFGYNYAMPMETQMVALVGVAPEVAG